MTDNIGQICRHGEIGLLCGNCRFGLLFGKGIIKRPARDACLYMGEASPPAPPAPPDPPALPDPPDLPDPHFVFAIAPIL